MHEMSIAERVVQIIEEQAGVQQFRRVRAVWLEVGVLAMVEPESLRFCFDAVTQGTLAQGATLNIIEKEAEAFCAGCERVVPLQRRFDPCPQCGERGLQVACGDELRIRDLEVE